MPNYVDRTLPAYWPWRIYTRTLGGAVITCLGHYAYQIDAELAVAAYYPHSLVTIVCEDKPGHCAGGHTNNAKQKRKEKDNQNG